MRRLVVLLFALGLPRTASAEPPPPASTVSETPPTGVAPAAPDTPEVPTTAPSVQAPVVETPPPSVETPPAEPADPAAPTPAHVPPAPPENERRAKVVTPAPRRRDFGLELDIGLNTRLGRNGSYSHEEAYGGSYGFGAWVALADNVELGLELTHTELGRVSNERAPDLVWAEYGVTTLWFGGRFEPWRSNDVLMFVALRLGLGAQSVDARGTRAEGFLLSPADSYACSRTEGPGLALGGGGGAAWLLGPRVQLIARLDANAHRLQSGWLGRCAVGIGSVTSVSVGVGLAYGFETSPAS